MVNPTVATKPGTVKTLPIIYQGAILEIPSFLHSLWPFDLPLNAWPTFCGSGEGIGDFIIPDKIGGVCVSAVCFIHDIDWAISTESKLDFQMSNSRLIQNLVSLLSTHIRNRDQYDMAIRTAFAYWEGVNSHIGWDNFAPCGTDPATNPIVQARLAKLNFHKSL